MSGRNAPRSKNGCSTCRRRKVKCGEERPVCQRCVNLQLDCEWGTPVPRGRLRLRGLQPAQPLSPAWRSSKGLTHIRSGSLDSAVSLPNFSATTSLAPLRPPLNSSGIPCANSLILSDQDKVYFRYFPSTSIVHYYMKGWDWSSFCYLYRGPAAANKVIMRMLLALSASDMHRNGLVVRSPGRPTAEDHSRYHYGLAAKEFRQLLESPKRYVSQADLEMVFATMFLMVIYEWQFGHDLRNLHLHLRGVQSLLEAQPGLFRIKDVNNAFLPVDGSELAAGESGAKVSFIPEQLLLWMLYVDIGCRPLGPAQSSLYDYVLESGNPALHPDHLHRCARLWGRCFWGDQYPDQEILDDIENYRALELLHVAMGLRYKTWKLMEHPGGVDYTAELLFNEMMAVRNNYSDLFITTKYTGGISARRTLNTIHFAVSNFYAQILLHRRLLWPNTSPTPLHRQATANILEIAHKQYNSDRKALRRMHWPLLMAVIETDNTNHRNWLRQRLREFGYFHSEYEWINQVADEVLAQQDASRGEYVDLAAHLKSRCVRQ